MTDTPNHFCPGCGATQKPFLRYPWYFCQPCIGRAEAGDGRSLKFSNTGFGGGFAFLFDPDRTGYTCGAALCEIGGRPVIVHEARFGGIVAEPVPARPLGTMFRNVVDLRGAMPNLDALKPYP